MIEILAAAIFPSVFSYEVNRAKSTISEYGYRLFRDERIHVRKGKNGSSITSFCGVLQYRSAETERVVEESFFWILRVQPQPGWLSDYERGQWAGGAGNALSAEYKKLCNDDDLVEDSALLRSTSFSSSGSTYDPSTDLSSTATKEWLVGKWVYAESCATSVGEFFRSDGFYDGAAGKGAWRLEGGKLALTLTSEYIADDSDEGFTEKWLPSPKTYKADIEKLGIDLAKLGGSDNLLRC